MQLGIQVHMHLCVCVCMLVFSTPRRQQLPWHIFALRFMLYLLLLLLPPWAFFDFLARDSRRASERLKEWMNDAKQSPDWRASLPTSNPRALLHSLSSSLYFSLDVHGSGHELLAKVWNAEEKKAPPFMNECCICQCGRERQTEKESMSISSLSPLEPLSLSSSLLA